ncbi:hypothetical protein P8452_30196 [Trifolium repens]|nr:hypothetical protein P8452_30196 [Trifolium repens]
MPCTSSNSKMDIKVVQSKSQKKIVITEGNGDFVDFIFSILMMPLGAIVKLLGPNSFAGCVGNLYKSVENLEPTSVLLNPGIVRLFDFPNQPLKISYVEPLRTTYYYEKKEGRGVIYKSLVSIFCPRSPLYLLNPRPVIWSKQDDVGFVTRPTLYAVGDDLKVKPLSADFRLSNLKGLSLAFDDLKVKVISIGEAEALSLLGAFLTSKFTLNSGLQDFLNVPKQESTFSKVLNKNQLSMEIELSISCSFSLCVSALLEHLAVSVVCGFPFSFYCLIGLWFF